jgi:transposase
MTPRKKPEDKLKVGRPSSYKPEYCDKIIEYGKLGHSIAQMASELDVAKATIFDWRDLHPEFATALARAQTHSQAHWESLAKTHMGDKNFNAQLWLKSVGSRFRDDYTDRKEVTGADGGPIKIETKTVLPDQLEDDHLDALDDILAAAIAAAGEEVDD